MLLLVAWSSLSPTTASAADTVSILRTDSPIVVDGRLDEQEWSGASAIDLPFEVRPGENRPARVETACYVAYDTSALYLGCRATDRPEEVRAYLSDRDKIGSHDRIVLFLDPYADGRRAFFFNVNPLGVQQDGILNGLDGAADLEWDAVWKSAGALTDDGYAVELAIPFSSLRFPRTGDKTSWRFFIERNWPRSEAVVFRSARLDPSNACSLCQAQALVGIEDVEPGKGVSLTPTLTTRRTDRVSGAGENDLRPGSTRASLGATGRVRITDDLAVNATVNPDFSQVEADGAQLDVNTRFSLFFPEKRPFFLDGMEALATPIQAVFTRTVADPRFGASLTGKVGSTLVASLVAQDGETNVLVPGNQSSTTVALERRSTTVVQRIRSDVGATGTVGAIYTGRFADGYRSQLVGADGFVRLSPLVRLSGQYLRSFTEDPAGVDAVRPDDRPPAQGHAGFVELKRSDWPTRRRWFGTLRQTWYSPGFRADAGFVPQVDLRRIDADVAWNTWSGDSRWFTRLNYWLGGHYADTFRGRLDSKEIWAWFSYNGPAQTWFWVWPRWGRQFFAGREFSTSYWELSLETKPAGDLTVGTTVKFGDAIDFANARQASEVSVSPNLTFRFGRRVDVGLEHRFERVRAAGAHVFTANLSQARLQLGFSPRAFARAIVQLRHTDRNPARYTSAVDRTSRSLFTQLLFSYRINAQTGLFLGYSDNRAGRTPEMDPRIPLTKTDRTFFLKVGYAWDPS